MQFSLKTLLWGTTCCAIACAVIAACYKTTATGSWDFPDKAAVVASALIMLAWWRARCKDDRLSGICLLAIGLQLSGSAAIEAIIACATITHLRPGEFRGYAIDGIAINIAPSLCLIVPASVACFRRPARGTKLVAASMVLCVLSSALTILTVLEAIRRQDLLR